METMYEAREVAKILNVTYDTVLRWAKANKIKATYENGKYYISELDLDEYLSKHYKYGNIANSIVQYHANKLYEKGLLDKLDKELRDMYSAKELLEESITRMKRYRDIVERSHLRNREAI